MAELKVLIYPYYREIVIPIKEEQSNRLLKMVEKCKIDWKNKFNEFLNVGYQGMEINFSKSMGILVNEENILLYSENAIQLLNDPKKKINDYLLKIAYKNYAKELNYFFDVIKFTKIKALY